MQKPYLEDGNTTLASTDRGPSNVFVGVCLSTLDFNGSQEPRRASVAERVQTGA